MCRRRGGSRSATGSASAAPGRAAPRASRDISRRRAEEAEARGAGAAPDETVLRAPMERTLLAEAPSDQRAAWQARSRWWTERRCEPAAGPRAAAGHGEMNSLPAERG